MIKPNNQNRSETPRVAFLVVCWNNKELLKDCFESIYHQTYKSHLTIMVDNGSADGSVDYVRANFPDVTIVEAGSNLGFAKGNNVAIQEAMKDKKVEYCALLNTDARLADDWLEKIINFTAKKPLGASFQGTTIDFYDHKIIDSTHIYVAKNGQATQAGYRQPYLGEFGPKKVFGTNAAANVFSRKFIEAQPFGAEFFDETMFMYLEDVDVAARATVMGWDNYLVPGAIAYHMGSASSGKNPGFSLYMTFRNNIGMLVKNFPTTILIKILPRLIKGDIETIKHLKRIGNKRAILMVIKGRLAGLVQMPTYLLKSRKLSKLRKIDASYLWRLMWKGY